MTPRQILEKTGYKIYCNGEVLADAPVGTIRGNVTTFTLNEYVSDDQLEKEYISRGIIPANLNEIISILDGEKHIATHWKDAKNRWCCAAFDRWDVGRHVYIFRRRDGDWHGGGSFAGVPQESALIPSEQTLDTLPSQLTINGIMYKRV